MNSKTDSVKHYYEFKNIAELHIVDSNYTEALEAFKKAFLYKKPNPRDLYNALVVAYLQFDSTMARDCFEQLVALGQTKEKFEDLSFGSRIKETSFYQWIKADYQTAREKATRSKLPFFAKKMDSILTVDQKIREEIANNDKPSKSAMDMVYADLRNINYIEWFTRKYGFPGYLKTGIFEEAMQGFSHAPNTIWVLLWHTRKVTTRLNTICRQAVLNGDFPPDDYAIIIDCQGKQRVFYEVFHKDQEMNFIPVAQEQKVDKLRSSVFLESIKDYKKKLAFQQRGKHPFFMIHSWAMALNFAPIDIDSWNN